MISLPYSLAAFAGLLSAVDALSISTSVEGGSSPKAWLYFLQNNPKAASIVALDTATGSTTVTMTGGKGKSIVDSQGHPEATDSLNSQGSVAMGGDLLFNVNPGSNSISMFKINPYNPSNLTQVGKPVDSQGDFPVSVTYSRSLQQACVLNGGPRNSVACYKVDAQKGLTAFGPARPLNRTIADPPVFGSGLVSEVLFSPDNSYLMATAKGPDGAPGKYFIWPIMNGQVSQQAVISSIQDMKEPFGFAFDGTSGKALVTDTTYGGSVISISKSFKPTELKHANESAVIGASCWAIYSPSTKLFYAGPAATPKIGIYSPTSGAFQGTIDVDKSFEGVYDMVLDPRDNETAYFLTGVTTVGGVNIHTKKVTANFPLSSNGVGPRPYWEGLAIYVA